MKKNVLVTGANGFIGRVLAARLVETREGETRGSVRRPGTQLPAGVQPAVVGELGTDTDWSLALAGVDCVIHTAGRAHVLRSEPDSAAAFRKANVEGALSIARQAMDAGVRRFIFISSIGVNGARTYGTPFSEGADPQPHAEYARSKLEAEVELAALCAGSKMELTIIRPPLVYHWNAPGNFRRLLGILARGWPLPFGAIDNRRSMVSLTNLVNFIEVCIDHPGAANETFVVADGDDVSLPRMIHLLTAGMGRRVTLVPVPAWSLSLASKAVGKYGMYEQLCGSLQIDITKARTKLGWQPPLSAENALRAAGSEYAKLSGRV